MVTITKSARTRFPETCSYIGRTFPNLQNERPQIWYSYLRISGLTTPRALRSLNETELPHLWFRDLGTVDGMFDPDLDDFVMINETAAIEFEKRPGDQEAQDFMLATILHEMIHWALHPNEPAGREMGREFEMAAFDRIIPRFWLGRLSAAELATAERYAAANPEHLPSVNAIAAGNPDTDLSHAKIARGIRNNNPGNIKRASANQWEGLADEDEMSPAQREETVFCVFKEPFYGLRALARTLRNYQSQHHLNDIGQIIGRWAPRGDKNDPVAYAKFVAARIGPGISVYDPIDVCDKAIGIPMIKAIIQKENSVQPYPDSLIEKAYEAGVKST